MWFKEPLHSKIKISTFLTPKRLLLIFNGIFNKFRYKIILSNMILEHFVVAHSRKTPILAIFGPKISKLKLMRYHIRWATDLKFYMDVDMVHSYQKNQAKIFYQFLSWSNDTLTLTGQPQNGQKQRFFGHQKKSFGQKKFFSVLIGRSFYMKLIIQYISEGKSYRFQHSKETIKSP